MYHLLLEGQNLACSGRGVLSYGWPEEIVEISGYGIAVKFGWKNIILDTDPARAVALLAAAVACLQGSEPKSSPGCEYCNFVALRNPEAKKAVAV